MCPSLAALTPVAFPNIKTPQPHNGPHPHGENPCRRLKESPPVRLLQCLGLLHDRGRTRFQPAARPRGLSDRRPAGLLVVRAGRARPDHPADAHQVAEPQPQPELASRDVVFNRRQQPRPGARRRAGGRRRAECRMLCTSGAKCVSARVRTRPHRAARNDRTRGSQKKTTNKPSTSAGGRKKRLQGPWMALQP